MRNPPVGSVSSEHGLLQMAARCELAESRSAALSADLTRLREREKELTEALTEIATADPVDLALDPTWSQRIAWAVLSSRTGSTEGDGT